MPLTIEQQQIVNHSNGHAKVIAVAGSGKTTTLVNFVIYKLVTGSDSRRILILMYNRSTRLDFTQRLQTSAQNHESGRIHRLPDVRTFHSLGFKIYKRLVQDGHLPAFDEKILSDREIEPILWRILQQCAPTKAVAEDILDQRQKWVEPALSFLDNVKSTLDNPESVFKEQGLPKQCEFFVKAFYQFEKWRKRERRISYADMLYDPCCLFSMRSDIAAKFSGHMQYVLVDEYQDINAIQQFLLDTLLERRGYLIAIGDPDQTIYEFRGSNPNFMLRGFDQRFPDHKVYTLSHTFRFGNALALSANYLITNNKQREDVLSISHSGTPKTEIEVIESQRDAFKTVSILKELNQNYRWSDISILHRLWAISAPIELALLEAGIPYQMDHDVTVLDRNELKPFFCLFRLAAGTLQTQSDNERLDSWRTLLTVPYPKIKRDLLKQLALKLSKLPADTRSFAQSLTKAIPNELSNWQQQQLIDRANLISKAQRGDKKAHELVQSFIVETDYYNGLKETGFSQQQIDDKVSTVKAFLRYLKTRQENASEIEQHLVELKEKQKASKNSSTDDRLTLSSIHKAKGLEWPVVIIPSLNQSYYPYMPEDELKPVGDIQSERRLLYVAMTRAKEKLIILAPSYTSPNGGSASNEKASVFLQQSQIKISSKVAKALTEETRNAGTNDPILLPEKSLSVASKYLKTVGSSIPLETSQAQPSIRTDYSKPSDHVINHAGRALIHSKLGAGHLLTETEDYWEVVFDSGKKSRLRKSVAGHLIEWLD